MAQPAAQRQSAGRPRRFDDQTERQMIVDAAVRVMGRDQTASISLDDVLAEADLSTRAFYRHFESKEELIETLILLEAHSFGRSLARAVSRAPDPVTAVEAWLSRFLDVYFQPRRFKRATMLTVAAAASSRPSAQMMQEMKRIACAPLIDVLRAGNEAGVLHSPTPEIDAYSIHDLVGAGTDTVAFFGQRSQSSPTPRIGRDAVLAHVMRFAWPALGLDPG